MKTKRSRNSKTRFNPRPARVLSVPDKHRLAIARKTMTMHCVGAWVMGDNHRHAASIIRELTGATVTIPADCTCKLEANNETQTLQTRVQLLARYGL